MPKLKQFLDKEFKILIGSKEIKFANNPTQPTYIKNRVDRILSKEPETIDWIKSFSKQSIFFDIGANIGIYTLYSAIIHENKVYSFEPHSVNYKNLLDSINLNELKNCKAYCFAVSNQVNLSSIEVKNMNEGVADNIVGKTGDYYHGCIELPLDSLVSQKILPQPDYIKIDVDGYENRVVEGALTTLSDCKSILIEIDKKNLIIVDQIQRMGFKIQSKHKRNVEEDNYIFVK